MNLREIKGVLGEEYGDLEQEARIKCLKYVGKPEYSIILRKVTHNLAVNWIRDRVAGKRGGPSFPLSTNFVDVPDGQDLDLAVDVRAALRRVIPDEKEARLVMDLLQHKNSGAEDFSAALGIPLRTASRYMIRVKAKLREELEAYK